MTSIDLINKSDEPIVIDPQESIRLFGDMDTRRIMSQRRKEFTIQAQTDDEYFGKGPTQDELDNSENSK